jgi:hypothetical protein
MKIVKFMKMKIFMVALLGILLPWASFAAAEDGSVTIVSPADAKIKRVLVQPGDFIYSGDEIATLKTDEGAVVVLRSGSSGRVASLNVTSYQKVNKGDLLGVLETTQIVVDQPVARTKEVLPPMSELLGNLFKTTGIYGIIDGQLHKDWTVGIGRILMILVGLILLYLGIFKKFEPLLLVPIGFGAILSNIPMAGIAEPGGILYYIYEVGITTGVFPLIIFMGVGALTDFGPMIANPKTILLGGAAQFGIFTTLLGALFLSDLIPGINFSLADAAAIGIIGGADGPTAIFLSSQLSPTTARLHCHRRLLLYGTGTSYSAAYYEVADHRGRKKNQDGPDAPCIEDGKNHPATAGSWYMYSFAAIRCSTYRYVHARQSGQRVRSRGPADRHHQELTDVHCDYLPWTRCWLQTLCG